MNILLLLSHFAGTPISFSSSSRPFLPLLEAADKSPRAGRTAAAPCRATRGRKSSPASKPRHAAVRQTIFTYLITINGGAGSEGLKSTRSLLYFFFGRQSHYRTIVTPRYFLQWRCGAQRDSPKSPPPEPRIRHKTTRANISRSSSN